MVSPLPTATSLNFSAGHKIAFIVCFPLHFWLCSPATSAWNLGSGYTSPFAIPSKHMFFALCVVVYPISFSWNPSPPVHLGTLPWKLSAIVISSTLPLSLTPRRINCFINWDPNVLYTYFYYSTFYIMLWFISLSIFLPTLRPGTDATQLSTWHMVTFLQNGCWKNCIGLIQITVICGPFSSHPLQSFSCNSRTWRRENYSQLSKTRALIINSKKTKCLAFF